MNRRSNKILRELILGSRQNVTELVEKYKVQERSIRADIKELNDALIEYDLPVPVFKFLIIFDNVPNERTSTAAHTGTSPS